MDPVTIALAVSGWLISAIISRMVTAAVEEWAKTVNLGEVVGDLKTKLQEIERLITDVNKSHLDSQSLLGSLKELQQAVYDAEDLLHELDYYRLQDSVEDKKNYQNQVTAPPWGIKIMILKVFTMAKDISCHSSKSTETGPGPSDSIPGLDGTRMTEAIKTVLKELERTRELIREALSLPRRGDLKKETENTNDPGISALIGSSKVVGRQNEKNDILNLLKCGDLEDGTLWIFPIVGFGGVGKTTLAKLVYDDKEVQDKTIFDVVIWLWLSATFDVKKLTIEMLGYFEDNKHHEAENLTEMQVRLSKNLGSKRVLLVLDNLWNAYKLDSLLAPFSGTFAKNKKVLVTTRYPAIAENICTVNVGPFELNDLEGDEVQKLFNTCIFEGKNPNDYPALINCREKIVRKLNGNPLEVRTICGVLGGNLDYRHWRSVLETDEWKKPTNTNGPYDHIMSALKISYQYLPCELQKCFSYCSLFPKNFKFMGDDLINLWIAQGFIYPKEGQQNRVLGVNALNELVGRGFFQEVKEESKYQQGRNTYYIMHELIHDLAKNVSSDEILIIDGSGVRNTGGSIRHVSIITNSSYNIDNRTTGTDFINELQKTMEKLKKQRVIQKLRTLILIGRYDTKLAKTIKGLFKTTKYLRVLRLSMESNNIDNLWGNFSNSLLLRYLKLEYGYLNSSSPGEGTSSNNNKLPRSVLSLYHLGTLDISDWDCGFDFKELTNGLVSMWRFHSTEKQLSMICEIGKLTTLEELRKFVVKRMSGFDVAQLGKLKELGGSLIISGLENIDSKEEAEKAELVHKKHLEELSLHWPRRQNSLPNVGTNPNVEPEPNDILEGLKPHSNISNLEIREFAGTKFPYWIIEKDPLILTSLQSLNLVSCVNLEALPPLGHLPVLEKLQLKRMPKVKEVTREFCGRFVPTPFKSLKEMVFSQMAECEKWHEMGRGPMFPSLKKLTIVDCPKLSALPPQLYPSGNEENHRMSYLTELVVRKCEKMYLPELPHSDTLATISISGILNPFKSLSLVSRCPGELSLSINWHTNSMALHQNALLSYNISALTELILIKCPFDFLPPEAFKNLPLLKRLIIRDNYPERSSSKVNTRIAKSRPDWGVPPSLELLEISSDWVKAKHLSNWLLSLKNLLTLVVDLSDITVLVVGDASTRCRQSNLQIFSSSLKCLQEVRLNNCENLVTLELVENGFQGFSCLQKLTIKRCGGVLNSPSVNRGSSLFPPSLLHLEIDWMPSCVQSEVLSNLTNLKSFKLNWCLDIQSLNIEPLHSLEELVIENCKDISSLEGVCSLTSLKKLKISKCPVLAGAMHAVFRNESNFSLPMQVLIIDDTSFLREEICRCLTFLRTLVFDGVEVAELEDDQKNSLEMLTLLRHIEFRNWSRLESLPRLCNLTSLTTLKITMCTGIISLQADNLPYLEELHIHRCDQLVEEVQQFRSSNKVKGLYIS